MFTLFENNNSRNVHVQSHDLFPEWDYVKRNMILNVIEVLERLHSRPMTTHKAHPLINYLMNIGFSLNTDLDTYMRMTEERSFFLTFTEGFVSSSSYGKVLNGIFYGRGIKELVIVDDSDFDYKKHLKNWKYIAPLQVLLSDVSDFSYLTPDGYDNWELSNNIAVFSLNLKKLLFVYYMWVKENKDKYDAGKDEMLLGTQHLLKMIILPNTLFSQIDMIVWNRLRNYFYGMPMSKPLRRLPFTVKDLTRRVDSSLMHMIKILTRTTYTYETLLNSIPAITQPNMYDFLQMPDLALTRQVNWAFAVSRASVFRFIIELGGQADITMNRDILVQARININLLRTEHILKHKLPDDIYEDIEEDLNFIRDSID